MKRPKFELKERVLIYGAITGVTCAIGVVRGIKFTETIEEKSPIRYVVNFVEITGKLTCSEYDEEFIHALPNASYETEAQKLINYFDEIAGQIEEAMNRPKADEQDIS